MPTRHSTNGTTGRLVAATLRGAWRKSTSNSDVSSVSRVPDARAVPPNLSLTDLDVVTPLLYDSGAAGLGWWRIRDTELSDTPSGVLLHQAFRLLTLHARIHEQQMQRIFRALRASNIEPILIKGWSVARRYPQLGLRPFGDIDLLVRPQQHLQAEWIAGSEELRDCPTDIHPGAFEVADRSVEDLFARSRLVGCDDEQVRVLSDEDQFALSAIHLLKHAAWRPLWLCDLALFLDSMSADFDWDLCLGTDARRANWILSAVGLARDLLDASICNERINRLAVSPDWLVETVLRNWEKPFATKHEPLNHAAPMLTYLRRPRGVLKDLKRRWPNPILATVCVNGTFGSRQRRRYQLRNCLQRTAGLIRATAEPA
jgi:putative nucleotidyltransferase-like protein